MPADQGFITASFAYFINERRTAPGFIIESLLLTADGGSIGP
jgi:hypothetical protein